MPLAALLQADGTPHIGGVSSGLRQLGLLAITMQEAKTLIWSSRS